MMSEIDLESVTIKIEEELARKAYPPDFPDLPPVPTGRYSSPAFAELERTEIWGKTWLLACLADALAEPGSYVLLDRKSVVWGRRGAVGVDLGGPRSIQKKKNQ